MSELKSNNEEITKEEKEAMLQEESNLEAEKVVVENAAKEEGKLPDEDTFIDEIESNFTKEEIENINEEIKKDGDNSLKNKFEESLKKAEKQDEDVKKDSKTSKENIEKNEKGPNKAKKSREKKSGKKGMVVGFIVAILVIILGLFSTVFAFLNINNDNIYKNIFINGIDVSNMSINEAKTLVEEKLNEKLSKSVNIKVGEEVKQITLEELETEFDIQTALNSAYNIGKEGNIFTNNFAILNQNFNRKNIEVSFEISEEKFDNLVADLQKVLPNAVVNFNTEVDGNKLIVTKGKKGNVVKEDELKECVLAKIKDYNEEAIEIPTKEIEPEKVTAEKLRNIIYKEPKNAYYEKEPKFVIYPHEVGVDFAGTIEDVNAILAEDKEEYIIPLKLTKPQVLTSDIGNEAFPDLLATFSTKYNAGNAGRSENMRLAANKINGFVLLPGETFSYNKVVGKRTVEAGYKEAAVYVSGKVVNGIGGGICQVSSTLYNSVLLSNLDIVERRNHYFKTSYVDVGRDATVSYGSIDFKFKNNRQYPIKILCYVKNGVCKVDIYGIKQDDDYEVRITSKVIETLPIYTEYEDTNTLKAGQTKKKQTGSSGARSETYRTLLRNGAVVSTELLSKDKYNVLPQIILRGTGVASVTPNPPKDVPANTTPTPPVTTPPVTTPPEVTKPSEPSGDGGTSSGEESGNTEENSGTSRPDVTGPSTTSKYE